MIAHGDIQPVTRSDRPVHYIAQHYWLEEEELRFEENYTLKEVERRRELEEAVEAGTLRAMMAQMNVQLVTETDSGVTPQYGAGAEDMYANAAPFRRANEGAGQPTHESTAGGQSHPLPSSWFAPRVPASNGVSAAAPGSIILQQTPSPPQQTLVGKLFGGNGPANPLPPLRRASTQPKLASAIDPSARPLDAPTKRRRKKRVTQPAAGTEDAARAEVAEREAKAAAIAAAEREAAFAAAELEAEVAAAERKAREFAAKRAAEKRAAEARAAEERAAAARAAEETAEAERAAAEQAAARDAAERAEAEARAAALRAAEVQVSANEAKSALPEGSVVTVEGYDGQLATVTGVGKRSVWVSFNGSAPARVKQSKVKLAAASPTSELIEAAPAKESNSPGGGRGPPRPPPDAPAQSSSPTPGSPRGEDNLFRRRANEEITAEKSSPKSASVAAHPSSPGSPKGGQDNIFRRKASEELKKQTEDYVLPGVHADADDEDPMARKASMIQGPARGMRFGSLMTARPAPVAKGHPASRSGDLGGVSKPSNSVSAVVDTDAEDEDPMARKASVIVGPSRGMRLGSLIVPPKKASQGAKAATPADLNEESAVAVHFQEVDLRPPKGMRLLSIFVPPRRGAGNVSASADVDEQSPQYSTSQGNERGMRLGGTMLRLFAPRKKTAVPLARTKPVLGSIGESSEGLEESTLQQLMWRRSSADNPFD